MCYNKKFYAFGVQRYRMGCMKKQVRGIPNFRT